MPQREAEAPETPARQRLPSGPEGAPPGAATKRPGAPTSHPPPAEPAKGIEGREPVPDECRTPVGAAGRESPDERDHADGNPPILRPGTESAKTVSGHRRTSPQRRGHPRPLDPVRPPSPSAALRDASRTRTGWRTVGPPPRASPATPHSAPAPEGTGYGSGNRTVSRAPLGNMAQSPATPARESRRTADPASATHPRPGRAGRDPTPPREMRPTPRTGTPSIRTLDQDALDQDARRGGPRRAGAARRRVPGGRRPSSSIRPRSAGREPDRRGPVPVPVSGWSSKFLRRTRSAATPSTTSHRPDLPPTLRRASQARNGWRTVGPPPRATPGNPT